MAIREWAPNPTYDEGLACFNAGDYEGALDRLARAVAIQPERARIHSNQAYVLLAMDRVDEARRAAEHARAIGDAEDPYPLWILAQVLDRAGESEGAVALVDTALGRAGCTAKDRVNLLVTKAWCLVHLERERLAIAAARDAMRVDASRADVHSILARTLALANRWGEGLRHVERALAIAPDNEEATELQDRIRQGLAIAEDGVAKARAECAKAPKDFDAWLALGTFLVMSGALADAAVAFDHAHACNPDKHDRWPDEPHMLSPWEVDCRIALLEDPAASAAYEAARAAQPIGRSKPARAKKKGRAATAKSKSKSKAPAKPKSKAAAKSKPKPAAKSKAKPAAKRKR